MSDKSELEAIRARDAAWSIQNCVTEHGSSDRRALLTHVDALEARVARLEGALDQIFNVVVILPKVSGFTISGSLVEAIENARVARAALAKTAHEKGPLGSDIPTDYKAAMNFHADRADKYMAERDAALAERDAARAELKEAKDKFELINIHACYASEENTDSREAVLLEIGRLARAFIARVGKQP